MRLGNTVHSDRPAPAFIPGNVSVEFWSPLIQFWHGPKSFARRERTKKTEADDGADLNSGNEDVDGEGAAPDKPVFDEAEPDEAFHDHDFAAEAGALFAELDFDEAEMDDPFHEVTICDCFFTGYDNVRICWYV